MRAALAAAVLVLAVAACGGDDSSSPAPPEASPPAAPSEPSEPAESAGGDAEAPDDGVDDSLEPADEDSSISGLDSEPVECELETVPSQVPLEDGRVHVDELPDGFAYNSVPASQGPHHPQWLRWGVYDRPVPELNVVHNLEHGGVTVQWGPEIEEDVVMAMIDWFIEDSDAIIMAPHDGLGGEIALAAWTVEDIDQDADSVYSSSEGNVLHCDGFDAAAFSEFRDNVRGRAPERIPIERMPAGSR
jgi:hypothetical protein